MKWNKGYDLLTNLKYLKQPIITFHTLFGTWVEFSNSPLAWQRADKIAGLNQRGQLTDHWWNDGLSCTSVVFVREGQQGDLYPTPMCESTSPIDGAQVNERSVVASSSFGHCEGSIQVLFKDPLGGPSGVIPGRLTPKHVHISIGNLYKCFFSHSTLQNSTTRLYNTLVQLTSFQAL